MTNGLVQFKEKHVEESTGIKRFKTFINRFPRVKIYMHTYFCHKFFWFSFIHLFTQNTDKNRRVSHERIIVCNDSSFTSLSTIFRTCEGIRGIIDDTYNKLWHHYTNTDIVLVAQWQVSWCFHTCYIICHFNPYIPKIMTPRYHIKTRCQNLKLI